MAELLKQVGWAAALAVLAPAGATGVSASAERVVILSKAPLVIRSGARAHRFTVEVARTEAEQARGLMFRRSVAPDGGMLFPFRPVRPAAFWMKNTLVPLDMLFIRADGTIARITTARALDLTPVESGEPVAAVLELRAGRARELGLREGDRVASPALRG